MSLIETYVPWTSQPPMDTPAGPGVHAVLHPLPGQVDLVTRLRMVYTSANPQSRYVVGRAGFGRFVSSSNARSLYTVRAFTAGSPLMLLSVFHTGNPAAQNDNVRIGNAPASFRLLEITTNTSGLVLASARGSDAVARTVTGPTITGGQVVAAVATYEPGAGVSLAVDGVDYGTTAFSQNLSHVPTVISDSISTNGIAYLSAWLDADVWRGRQVELTQNPWIIFEPRRVWVPVSADTPSSATTDYSPSYSVAGSAHADLPATFSTLGSAARDLAASFQLLSGVSGDLTASFSIRGSAQGDLVASCYLLGASSTDLPALYEVAGGVQLDLVSSYGIGGAVQTDLAPSYGIRSSLTTDFDGVYALLASPQSDLSGSYHVIESLTRDFTATYTTRSSAQLDLGASYSLSGVVFSDFEAQFVLGEVASNDLGVAYAVQSAPVSDVQSEFVVLGSASSDLASDFVVRGAAQADFGAFHHIQASAYADLATTSATLGSAEADVSCEYATLGDAWADAESSYDIFSSVEGDLTCFYTTGDVNRLVVRGDPRNMVAFDLGRVAIRSDGRMTLVI